MSEKKKENGRTWNLLSVLKAFFTENIGRKVAALLVAVILWAGLISQDATLTREKTFSDVTISVVGADTLKRNGYVVLSDLSGLHGATMTASVPQIQYQNAAVSNYNPRIDLSRIRSAGTVTLNVLTTSTTTNGAVTNISPSSITVEIDEYITRYRIPVTLVTTGELPEGFWSSVPSYEPNYVVVSGPASRVRQIVRAVAELDLSTLPAREGSVSTAVPITLCDATGSVIDGSAIEVTSQSVLIDSIAVSQMLYASRKLPLAELGLTAGEPAAGYRVSAVTTTPAEVSVAGPTNELSGIDTLFADGAVDVTGRTESFQAEVRLRKPDGAAWMSTNGVTVSVTVEPVIETADFNGVRLGMTGLESGVSISSLPVKTVTVSVTGEQLKLAALRSSQLTAVVDLSGITEPGSYELPVSVRLNGTDTAGFTFAAEPAFVTVEISGN